MGLPFPTCWLVVWLERIQQANRIFAMITTDLTEFVEDLSFLLPCGEVIPCVDPPDVLHSTPNVHHVTPFFGLHDK